MESAVCAGPDPGFRQDGGGGNRPCPGSPISALEIVVFHSRVKPGLSEPKWLISYTEPYLRAKGEVAPIHRRSAARVNGTHPMTKEKWSIVSEPLT